MTSVIMNLSMSTKIPDLLDPNGQIPEELNSRGLNLVNFLGEIVTSVSGSRELICSDPIQCRKYEGKKRCGGRISAWCEEQSELSPIEWCCFDCGEGGIIYDWQGSIFDKRELRKKKVHEHMSKGVWLNDLRIDEVQMLLQPEPGFNGDSYLRYPSNRIIVNRAEDGVVRLMLPPLLVVELFQRGALPPSNGTVTLQLGHENPMHYCFSQVRYPDSSDGTVELEFMSKKL